MPRPSRNVDQKLLRAGRALFPAAGCAGLSVRRLAEHAGVNAGMFHYHFRTKDAFVRALLQDLYDEMFASLALAAGSPGRPLDALRGALLVLARFARDQGDVLRRILIDALEGHAVARDFVRRNFPRHVEVVVGLVRAAQGAGTLAPLALPQALAFLAGAVGAPVLVAGGMIDNALVSRPAGRRIARAVLADAAIGERIDLAVRALAPHRARR